MNTFSPIFMQPYCTIFIVTSMWIYHSAIVFLSLFISITVFFFFHKELGEIPPLRDRNALRAHAKMVETTRTAR